MFESNRERGVMRYEREDVPKFHARMETLYTFRYFSLMDSTYIHTRCILYSLSAGADARYTSLPRCFHIIISCSFFHPHSSSFFSRLTWSFCFFFFFFRRIFVPSSAHLGSLVLCLSIRYEKTQGYSPGIILP